MGKSPFIKSRFDRLEAQMNDFCSLWSSPFRVQPVRRVWGGKVRGRQEGTGVGGWERGDSGLKVKNLERMPRLGVNLKPESSVRVGRLSREQHFSY